MPNKLRQWQMLTSGIDDKIYSISSLTIQKQKLRVICVTRFLVRSAIFCLCA